MFTVPLSEAKKWKQFEYHTVEGGMTTPLNWEITKFKISLRVKHTFSYRKHEINE